MLLLSFQMLEIYRYYTLISYNTYVTRWAHTESPPGPTFVSMWPSRNAKRLNIWRATWSSSHFSLIFLWCLFFLHDAYFFPLTFHILCDIPHFRCTLSTAGRLGLPFFHLFPIRRTRAGLSGGHFSVAEAASCRSICSTVAVYLRPWPFHRARLCCPLKLALHLVT